MAVIHSPKDNRVAALVERINQLLADIDQLQLDMENVQDDVIANRVFSFFIS